MAALALLVTVASTGTLAQQQARQSTLYNSQQLMANQTQESIQQTLFPGVTGNALIDSIRVHFRPAEVKLYGEARDSMFMSFYYTDGGIVCFYTGDTVFVARSNARILAQNAGFNTEHIWPQSKFLGRGNAYSDLHHLRPSRADVNQSRNNYRFAFLDPAEVTHYWRGKTMVQSRPAGELGTWSKTKQSTTFDNSLFEPRDAVKGDVARAMFYFYTMYEDAALATDRDFFASQMEDLYDFHYVDPADSAEHARTLLIASIQSGKANPFVLDSTLIRRAFFTDYAGPMLPPVEEGAFEAEFSFSGTADCNDEDLSPNRQSPGITITDFRRVGVNCNVVSNALNSNGWPGDFSDGRYVGFTGMADEGYQAGFKAADTLSMFIRRSGTGPAQYRVYLVSGGERQVLREGALNQANTNVQVKIGMPVLEGLESFEVRIHAWGASATGGTFRISSFKLTGAVTSTGMGTHLGDDVPDVPGGVTLHPAYPNPFNPSTNIRFTLARAGHVDLALYDVTGRKVRQIATGMYPSGSHTAQLDASGLSSGVYLVRLEVGKLVATGMVTLVK